MRFNRRCNHSAVSGRGALSDGRIIDGPASPWLPLLLLAGVLLHMGCGSANPRAQGADSGVATDGDVDPSDAARYDLGIPSNDSSTGTDVARDDTGEISVDAGLDSGLGHLDGGHGSAIVVVQVLAFNDFHGNIEEPAGSSGQVVVERTDAGLVTVPAGGAAYLAKHVEEARAQHTNTVVVSAGDLIGASPLGSALFHDEPTIEVMNALGLDLSAVGNHEFDDGVPELLRMQFGGCHPTDGCADGTGFAGAAFTFLAANAVVDGRKGETLLPRYEVKTFDGVPIAFIGMTLEDTPSLVPPLGVAGLEFRDETETVNAIVPELRARGIEAIVVVVHEGGLQTGLYDQCEGISGAIVDIVKDLHPAVDLVLSGHTHAAYNCEIAGKRVTSALSFGRLVTRVVLDIDRTTHDVTRIDAKNEIVSREVAPEVVVSDLVEKYVDLVAPLRDRVIGHATEAMTGPRSAATTTGESTLGNLIADAQLYATKSVMTGSADIAFMNPGGVRSDLAAGEITFGNVFAVQPFGNTLVVITLTGAELHDLLEQQFQPTIRRILQPSEEFRYTWKLSAENGDRVDPTKMFFKGRPIDLMKSYRVTVNSFLAAGGDGFTVLKAGRDRVGGPLDVDALSAYLTAHDPIAPAPLGRIQVEE